MQEFESTEFEGSMSECSGLSQQSSMVLRSECGGLSVKDPMLAQRGGFVRPAERRKQLMLPGHLTGGLVVWCCVVAVGVNRMLPGKSSVSASEAGEDCHASTDRQPQTSVGDYTHFHS